MSKINYGPAIHIPNKTPPEGLDLSTTGGLQWTSAKDLYDAYWSGTPTGLDAGAVQRWTSGDWNAVQYIRLPADHPYYTPEVEDEVDYSKPIQFTDEHRTSPPMSAKQLGDSDLFVVTWPAQSDGTWASGYCLFDKHGKWVGDLSKPDGRGGSGLFIKNQPEKRTVYADLHEESKWLVIYPDQNFFQDRIPVDFDALAAFIRGEAK